MTMFFNPALDAKFVEAMANATDAAGRTGRWVSLKNYALAYIIVNVTQGNAATIAISINQATAVAGTGSKVITNTVPIWSNLSTAATDTLVARTAAVNYTTDAGVANKQVIFQVDPSSLDLAGGFDCIAVVTGASNVANLTSAQYLLVGPRYGGATPPSAIID
jgi:hypothetical protein